MSRNGAERTEPPGSTTITRPACSVTNSRPLPSPAFVIPSGPCSPVASRTSETRSGPLARPGPADGPGCDAGEPMHPPTRTARPRIARRRRGRRQHAVIGADTLPNSFAIGCGALHGTGDVEWESGGGCGRVSGQMTTTRASLRRVAERAPAIPPPSTTPDEPAAGAVGTRRTIAIERVDPELDGGRHAVKRIVGDTLLVTADIFADGHDLLDAVLLLRAEGERRWHETPMRLVDNDRWSGRVELEAIGRHRYTIEAWRDAWGSWRNGLRKKVEAEVGVATELAEGRLLLEAAISRADATGAGRDATAMRLAMARFRRARSEPTAAAALADKDLLGVVRRHPDRSWATRYDIELPLMVDRERARLGALYELFPRSQGRRTGEATTLTGAEWRLPQIAAMGFDVVYLPPIHPIGRINRKGPNNTLRARRGDPGSPYAIGSVDGGHTEVAPELGGLPELDHFRRAVEANGMELALDLALQVAPDHPLVRLHPEWFRHAPDGTIKYAENPPKQYQDIYPIDFYGADAAEREALWREWLRIVLVWVERGIRIFRVDNPHTKPIPFWAWLIGEVQHEHPDVLFLSEAFTRPAMMRALAKAGFSQSYTYFTWRETASELRDYLTELTASQMREYFRGNLFTN